MSMYKMTPKELILTSGSSKGSQIKFFKDGYWYKIDENGPAGIAEETVSKLLQCSSLSKDEFVNYESCKIQYNDDNLTKEYDGCRSKSFLEPGEMFYSYEKIYKMMTGNELSEDIIKLNSPKERIEYTASIIKDFCGLDVKDYISKNLTCDMLFINTDRHFNNLGIISNYDQTSFRNAPIFDNGAAFLSNYTEYPPNISIDDIKSERIFITGKPFAANLEYQAIESGITMQFDYSELQKVIENIPNKRIREIVNFQCEKYKSLLQKDYYQGIDIQNYQESNANTQQNIAELEDVELEDDWDIDITD